MSCSAKTPRLARSTNLAHMIRLEELNAQPDDLLSYHFWAEDYAANGSLRRTESDMYFAEVRPFEEIFRQGEQPPGGQQQQRQQGQSQNAMQAQQLAQLQKEIINATWKVIRREIGSKLTEPFASDVEQIQLSQGSALEQATALVEKLQDPQSQEHGEAVLRAMQEAITQLRRRSRRPGRQAARSGPQSRASGVSGAPQAAGPRAQHRPPEPAAASGARPVPARSSSGSRCSNSN